MRATAVFAFSHGREKAPLAYSRALKAIRCMLTGGALLADTALLGRHFIDFAFTCHHDTMLKRTRSTERATPMAELLLAIYLKIKDRRHIGRR